MTSLAVTVIGNDRTGIIEQIADTAASHQANWLESQMAILVGQFAGIVLLDVPDNQEGQLKHALEALSSEGLYVTANPTNNDTPDYKEITFELLGQDNPGIVRDITAALSSINVSIAELETQTLSGSMSGEMMFKARARALLPERISITDIDEILAEVSNDLMVDIVVDETEPA